MLGYQSAEEVLALKLPADLDVDPTQRAHLRAHYEPVGVTEGVELLWKKKNGGHLIVSLYARTILDTHGAVIGGEGMALTDYNDDEDIYRAFQAGAAAYVLKDTTPEDLAETIRAVHAGQRRVPAPIAAKLTRRMCEPELTPREHEILRLLAAGKSTREIGRAVSLSVSTVKTQITHLLRKLGAGIALKQ
jgi:DNA-binding NarL/FixJ family response regulator